jgi:hypothetical protein
MGKTQKKPVFSKQRVKHITSGGTNPAVKKKHREIAEAQFKLLTEEFDAQFASEVRKTPLFAMPCIYKNERFTKTGSGQT